MDPADPTAPEPSGRGVRTPPLEPGGRLRRRREVTGDAAAATPGTAGAARSRRLTWVERRPGHRVWVGGPVPPGAAAWTLGSLVIVRRRWASDERLMAHEEEHVRQWEERGVGGFLARYLGSYLLWRLRGYPHAAAYRRIPAEIEAEWRARRRLGIGAGPAATGKRPPAR